MRSKALVLVFAVGAVVSAGSKTDLRSVKIGDYKIVYGEMGSGAQYWQKIKAPAAGWEVVGEANGGEGGVLVLRKPK